MCANKIVFMTRKNAAMAVVLASAVLLAGCSEAPVVPIQPTNRRVFAELIGETG